jgi:hypothetical protein
MNRSCVFAVFSFLLYNCTKQEGVLVSKINNDPILPPPSNCGIIDSTRVNYTDDVKKIFDNNCLPCHAKPGSGGINLDTKESCEAALKSGQIIPVIILSPGNIMMPPPPQKALDSCEIKALNLWLKQG